jgi:hypothetical protein
MEFAKRFGGNLRRIREGAGLSQEALGLRCSSIEPRSACWSAANGCPA